MRGIEAATCGMIGTDIDLRTSKNGKPFANFNLAVAVGQDEDDLPGLDFDFAELDELLGLGDPPNLEPGEGRFLRSPKNARARDMGYSGESATKSKQVCGAKTRTGKPCQAPGNGRGGRCKLHGGKSTGPKTKEGKARSLAALQGKRNVRK